MSSLGLAAQLTLKGATPLGKGRSKFVFAHPYDDALLVKVVRPEAIEQITQRIRWYKALRGYHIHREFEQMVAEYIGARTRAGEPVAVLETIAGFATTDLGFGLMVEKVRGADGELAPLLTDVVRREGLTPPIRTLIDAFLADLNHHHIVTSDLHPGNVLLGEAGGQRRLVMIDGYGEAVFLPVYSASKRLNAMRNTRKFVRFRERLATVAKAGAAS